MKIDLAIDLDPVNNWDVYVCMIALVLAFGIFMFVRYELAQRFPVNRLIARRWFGV